MAYQISTASGIPDVCAQIAAFAAANAGFTNQGTVTISGRVVQRLLKGGTYFHMAHQFDGTNFMRFNPSKVLYTTDWRNYNDNSTLYTGNYPQQTTYMSFLAFPGPYPGLYLFTDGLVVHAVVELTNGIYNHMSFGTITKTDTFTGGDFMTAGCYTYFSSGVYQDLLIPGSGNTTPWLHNYSAGMGSAVYSWMYLPPASGATNNRFDWVPFGNRMPNVSGLLPRGVRGNNREGVLATLLDRSPNTGTMRSVMFPQLIDIWDPVSNLFKPAGHVPNMRLVNMKALDEKELIYTDWQVFPISQRNGSSVNAPNSQEYAFAYKR